MKIIKVIPFALMAVLLTGCLGTSDLELENRELRRQVDTLKDRNVFLQNEVDRFNQVGEIIDIREDTDIDSEQLICGGLAGFLCPDGYICLDKGTEPDATGTCVASDKILEYREKQREAGGQDLGDSVTQDAVNASAVKEPCGVLGEKINRNPSLGSTSRTCCDPLEEDRVSKSYSICRKAGTVVNTEPVETVETEPVSTPEPISEPIVEPEAEESETSVETSEPAINGTDGDEKTYTIRGFTTYETQGGGFTMKYPSYWYYGGYGMTGGALWMAGFAPEALNDEGTNIVIYGKLKEGTADERSWSSSGKFYCTADLGEDYMEVSGPSPLATEICQMADSAQLITDDEE